MNLPQIFFFLSMLYFVCMGVLLFLLDRRHAAAYDELSDSPLRWIRGGATLAFIVARKHRALHDSVVSFCSDTALISVVIGIVIAIAMQFPWVETAWNHMMYS